MDQMGRPVVADDALNVGLAEPVWPAAEPAAESDAKPLMEIFAKQIDCQVVVQLQRRRQMGPPLTVARV